MYSVGVSVVVVAGLPAIYDDIRSPFGGKGWVWFADRGMFLVVPRVTSQIFERYERFNGVQSE